MRIIMLFLLLFYFPSVKDANSVTLPAEQKVIDDVYTMVRLADTGLAKEVFRLALKGMNKLQLKGSLHNLNILTIADYSQSSNKKRLYVIDLKNKKLLFNTYVAHGRNTGSEYARYFSNIEGSNKSSLGFYITDQPVTGAHTGFSLLLKGVEKGINDHALKRSIIIHGAEYATENFIKKYGRLGRSQGCPALPPEMNKPIIDSIKGGTCLFVYNPDATYISSSALLN